MYLFLKLQQIFRQQKQIIINLAIALTQRALVKYKIPTFHSPESRRISRVGKKIGKIFRHGKM